MAELTVANLFDTAYEATVKGINLAGYSTDAPWDTLVGKLKKVAPQAHLADAHAASLDELRKLVGSMAKKGKNEGDVIWGGSGAAGAPSAATADAKRIQRCAAVKTLRHAYFLRRKGSQQIWVVSLPKSFAGWPDRYLKSSVPDLLTRLAAGDEQFSVTDRKHLSDASQRGLAWVGKAQVTLGDLGPKSRGLRVLRRWFGDEATTDDQLKAFAGTLTINLKKIAGKLSGGALVFTDFVPIRHSGDAGDAGFLRANAFVWADTRDVIYIEPPFFKRAAKNVFHSDAYHWARIVVHELTHREAKTLDKRYGWAGLKPRQAVFPHADAIVNADSWALFVADAAGAMNRGDKLRGLNGA